MTGVPDRSEGEGGESWARLANVDSEDLISSHTFVGTGSPFFVLPRIVSLCGVKHAYINQTILWLDSEGEMLI